MQGVNNYISTNPFDPTFSPLTTSAPRNRLAHSDFTYNRVHDLNSSKQNVQTNLIHFENKMLVKSAKAQLVGRQVKIKKRIPTSVIVDGVRREVASLQDELNRLQNQHNKRQIARMDNKIQQRWQIALSIMKNHSMRACRENENLISAREEYQQIINEMKKYVQRCVKMESPTQDVILQNRVQSDQLSGCDWDSLRNSVHTQLLDCHQILSTFDVSNMKTLTPIVRCKKTLKVSCERRQSIVYPFGMDRVASASWTMCEKDCSSFDRHKTPEMSDGEILQQGTLRLEMRRVQVAVPCRIVKLCREVDGNICICGVVVGRVPSSLVSMHQTPEESSAFIELHARVWFIYRKLDGKLGNAANEPMCQQVQFSTIELHSDGDTSQDGNGSVDSDSTSRMKIFRRVGLLADLFRHAHDADIENYIQNTENQLMDEAIRG